MNKKMKLSLLGILIIGSFLTITLPLVSCSASSEKEEIINNNKLFANEDDLNAVEESVAKLLKYELEFAKTNQAQKNIVNEWKENEIIPYAYIAAIRNRLNFKNSDGVDFKGEDVIESVIFYENGILPNVGDTILSPKLKVVLKGEYTSNDDILINPQSLGNVLDDIIPYDDEGEFGRAIRNLQINLVNEFDSLNTRAKQQALLNSWIKDSEMKTSYQNEFKNNVAFVVGLEPFYGYEVIESITFNSEPKELPPPGVLTSGPQIKINLKPEYAPKADILIDILIIGFAADA
ncbi:MAG: hypothetical protein ACRCUM_01625 [Mycoplasmoidaceae bacterium]